MVFFLNKFDRTKKEFGEVAVFVEDEFDRIDKLFAEFERAMDNNDYVSVEKRINLLDEKIIHMGKLLEDAPTIVLMATVMVPNKIAEATTYYYRMQRDGYPLDYLNVEYNIKEIKNELLKDSYYEIDHSSGFKIFVYPKENYSSTYAVFGTKYGSIDTCFKKEGEKDFTEVPEGIAHFLEHKLFESEELDAFTRYAKTGASANAYTSFDKTCYLFQCSGNFEDSLEILLDFVSNPYFTEQTVQKEQGIIGQEIKMYEDSPEWRVLFNLLCAMYHNHPVKVDIAGSIESIARITPESLYTCYNSYYNLHNMALSVVGNVEVDEVLKICDKYLKEQKKAEVKSLFPSEPYEIKKAYTEQTFPVAVPIFNLGFKLKADRLHNEEELAHLDILLFMLASSTSPMYRELMDKGLINSTFSYEMFEGSGYSAIIFSGESRDPQQVAEIVRAYFDKVKAEGLDEKDFADAKKATYGDALSSLNSVDTIANMLEDFYFSKRNIFSYYDAITNATLENAMNILNEIDTANSSLSVVKGE